MAKREQGIKSQSEKRPIHQAPWVKFFGLLLGALALAFFVWRISETWSQIWTNADWGPVHFAILGYGVFIFLFVALLGAVVWTKILAALGESIQFEAAAEVFCLSQMGKYLPGNFAHLLGRVILSQKFGLNPKKTGMSLVVETLLILGIGAALALSAIPILRQSSVSPYALLGLIVICVLGLLIVFIFFRKTVATLARGPRFLEAGFLQSVSYLLQGSVLTLIGMQFVEGEMRDIEGLRGVFYHTGILAIAFSAGMMTPGAPAGLGVREVTLALLLQTFYSENHALLISLLSRLVQMGGDGIAFVLGLALRRQSGKKKP